MLKILTLISIYHLHSTCMLVCVHVCVYFQYDVLIHWYDQFYVLYAIRTSKTYLPHHLKPYTEGSLCSLFLFPSFVLSFHIQTFLDLIWNWLFEKEGNAAIKQWMCVLCVNLQKRQRVWDKFGFKHTIPILFPPILHPSSFFPQKIPSFFQGT